MSLKEVCQIDGDSLSVLGKEILRSEIKYIPAEINALR